MPMFTHARSAVGRPLLLLAILAAALSPGIGRASAEQPNPLSVDAAFKQRFLAGDLDGVLDLFAPDAMMISYAGTFHGRAELRGFFNMLISRNPGLMVNFEESQVIRNTTVHRVFASSDTFRAAGASRVVAIHTLVIQDGMIISFTNLFDLSDPETARFVATSGG
jgi:ketosteroid isomerase-like protein